MGNSHKNIKNELDAMNKKYNLNIKLSQASKNKIDKVVYKRFSVSSFETCHPDLNPYEMYFFANQLSPDKAKICYGRVIESTTDHLFKAYVINTLASISEGNREKIDLYVRSLEFGNDRTKLYALENILKIYTEMASQKGDICITSRQIINKQLKLYKNPQYHSLPIETLKNTYFNNENITIRQYILIGLGMTYADNGDYENSTKYFQKAHELENLNAIYYIGNVHYVNKEFQEAFKCYELALGNQNNDAQYCLGSMHEKGLHVNINLDKAAEFYSKSDKNACCELLNTHHKNITWQPCLHTCWPNAKNINKIVIMLLFISKHRNKSTIDISGFAKNVMLIVIKYVMINGLVL